MCGIGVAFFDYRSAAKSVTPMTRALIHRGTDDEGIEYFALPGGVDSLGQRRLSILDLSAAGHQPMTHTETGDWIVFKGEIYNYPQLRAALAGGRGTLSRSL